MSKKPTPLPVLKYTASSGVPLTVDAIRRAARRRKIAASKNLSRKLKGFRK